jgi:hypothetical protein
MFSQGYIGVSKNAERRFKQHFEKKHNQHLVSAIRKYGWDNLVKKQILIAEEDYCYDIEGKLRPTINIGWNISMGGGVPPTPLKVHGEGMRQKMSAINKLRLQDPVAREKFAKARLGSTAWNRGKKASPETIEKLKATFEANRWTCPHCNKTGLNKGSGNRWHFDNCKEI